MTNHRRAATRTRRPRGRAAFFSLLLAGCAAEGRVDAGLPLDAAVRIDADLTVDYESYPLSERLCRAFTECEALSVTAPIGAHVTCHPRTREEVYAPLHASVEAGRIRFDPVAQAVCARYEAMAGCRVMIGLDPAPDRPPECDQIWTPQVPPGGRCVDSRDCVRGFCDLCSWTCRAIRDGACILSAHCPRGESCIDGACRELGAVGDPCSYHRDCRAGSSCLWGSCAEQAGEGALCLRPEDCVADLVCVDDSCVPAAGLSEPCGEDEPIPCGRGLRCGSDGRCIPTVGPGDACASSEACPREHWCEAGSCEPLPWIGEPCGPPPCAAGSCHEGVCRRRGWGAPCRPGARLICDEGLYCNWDTNTCQRLGRPGTPCVRRRQCEASLLCAPDGFTGENVCRGC